MFDTGAKHYCWNREVLENRSALLSELLKRLDGPGMECPGEEYKFSSPVVEVVAMIGRMIKSFQLQVSR